MNAHEAFTQWFGYPNVPVSLRDAFEEAFVQGWNAKEENTCPACEALKADLMPDRDHTCQMFRKKP